LLIRRTKKRTIPIDIVANQKFKAYAKGQSQAARAWFQATNYQAADGALCLLPGADGTIARVVLGVSNPEDLWSYAALPAQLPSKHIYEFSEALGESAASAAALGWLLGEYRFNEYKKDTAQFPRLVWPVGSEVELVTALSEGITLCRDLVNTPASDLGPDELSEAGKELGKSHGAKVSVIRGDKLLTQGYPAVHAVGRASTRPPQLFDLRWGNPKHPKLTLVGKGVCFDSGGLDLKPASNMKLMKKDMGGAAAVLGLAHVVMSLGVPVRLRVLVPAVENSVSGNAMRPLDVLSTRKGLTVEVGNTDAEGRLILADALTEADSETPDLLIDMATLTGAARVALGTGLPALFSNDDAVADATLEAGVRLKDPLWRLPLHDPYRQLLDSPVADLNNVSSGGYGGAITAALFLREFISRQTPWMHIDTMGYNLESRPGRPAGGEALALRALADVLVHRYTNGG
jgi:leucyl aminopeptidase